MGKSLMFKNTKPCTLRSRKDVEGEGGSLNKRRVEKFIKSNKQEEEVRIRGGWIFVIFTTKIWLFVTKSVTKFLYLLQMSCKYQFYNVVFIKSLQILSRFQDIRNGKEKILKCGAYLNNYYILLLAGLNCIWNQHAKNKKNIVDN